MAWPEDMSTTLTTTFGAALFAFAGGYGMTTITAGTYGGALNYSAGGYTVSVQPNQFTPTFAGPLLVLPTVTQAYATARSFPAGGYGTTTITTGLFGEAKWFPAGGYTATVVPGNFYWTFTHPNVNYSVGGYYPSGIPMTLKWG